MKNLKHLSRRLLAVLVALLLCVGTLPVAVFAETAEGAGTEISDTNTPETGDDTPSSTDPEPDGGSDAPAPEAPDHSSRVPDDANVETSGRTETDEETGKTTSTSSSTATYEGTTSNGGEVNGQETTSNTIVTDKDGNLLENSSSSSLTESTNNPTVTNPDGSTTESGSGHTEGKGDKTTIDTEITSDPDNATEPVQPTDEEIDKKAGDGESPKTDLGEYTPVMVPVLDEDGNPVLDEDGNPVMEESRPVEETLPDENVSNKSDEWLRPNGTAGTTVNMTQGGSDKKEIDANVGDWEKTIQGKIDAAPGEGYEPYVPTKDDQIEAAEGAKIWKNGNSIVVVTPKYEGEGENRKLVGYTSKTYLTTEGEKTDLDNIVTLKPGTEESKAPVREDGENGEKDNRTEVYTFDIPSRPAAGTSVDASGTSVSTTVTELLSEERYVQNEDGTYSLAGDGEEGVRVVVGYMVDTVVVDINGNRTVSSRSDWGVKNQIVTTPIRTENSAQWTVVTDRYTVPVTRAVTTNDLTLEFTEDENGKVICSIWGSMGTVNDNSTTTNMNGLQVDLSKGPSDFSTNSDDLRNKEHLPATGTTTQRPAGDGDYLYLGGTGLTSALCGNANGGHKDGTRVHQFVIYDENGQPHYAYCADLDVDPIGGKTYGKVDAESSNYWGTGANGTEIAKHVQAIALNGYWGTEKGTGSLDSVKDMMKDAISKGKITGITSQQVDALTDGMAMAATQTAIWSYATSGDVTLKQENPFGVYVYNGKSYSKEDAVKNGYLNANALAAGTALYNYLRTLEETGYKAEKEITSESISSTAITVKEVIRDSNGNPVLATQREDTEEYRNNSEYKYNTDVSFVLETEPSQLNDDLLVTITDSDGGKHGPYRISGTGTEKTAKRVGNTYVLENVQLGEGVTITLNLHGTQLLEKQAYVIVAQDASGKPAYSDSQTFVTAEDKTKNVNLTVNLEFSVREPVATLSGTTVTENLQKVDEYGKELDMTSKWNTYDHEAVTTSVSGFVYYSDSTWSSTTPNETPRTPEDPEDPDGPGPGTPGTPTPQESTVVVPEETTPLAELSEDVEIPEEETPLAEIPEEDLEIPDEDIPLADVPHTGDISSLWSILLLASAAGLLLLTRKKAEEAEG